MSSLERRSHSRSILAEKNVLVKTARSSLEGSVVNINQSGARLLISKSFPVGSFVEVSFKIPDAPSLSLTSRIIWKKTEEDEKKDTPNDGALNESQTLWRYGILFYQLNSQMRESIKSSLKVFNEDIDRRAKVRRTSEFTPLENNRHHERRGSKEFLNKINRIGKSFDKWTSFHTYLRSVEAVKPPHYIIDGQKKIMLGSNSYLGLTMHPVVKEAAIKAIEKFGVGSGGVPVLSGTTTLHDELCETIAKFKGTEAAIIYPSGFIANYTCLSTLFGEDDLILNDERNHASIIDGGRMAKSKLRYFKHNDMDDLEKKISQYDFNQNKIIIVDGVYSMDGDVCNLSGIYSLAKKYNCLLMVDDAHSTGVMGKTGRGTAEHFGLMGKIDLTTVTMSKALGCIGGAICGSKSLIKFLIHQSRSFIFSTSLPPPICAGAIAALKLIQSDPSILQSLRRNVAQLKEGLQNLGYRVAPTDSAIIPVIIGDETLTYKLTYSLDKLGVFVNAVSRPAVSRELSRLRVSPNAMQTEEDIDLALKAFKTAGKALGLI